MSDATPAPRIGLGDEKRDSRRADPEFCRAENEDDDGYDPWSDRRPDPEPLWEEDPGS